MIYSIFFYTASLVGSWLLIRDYNMQHDTESGLGDVFYCICPILNTLSIVILLLLLEKRKTPIININWNKFFMIKEKE